MNNVASFPLSNQKPRAKLYMMNLTATDTDGQTHLFFHSGIAMSKQDAFLRAMATMKHDIPELYALGQAGSGFKIAMIQEMSWNDIQRNFKNFITPQQIQFKVVEQTKEEKLSEKNQLIKTIIETRDRALLEASKDKLNEYEISYINDTIA